MFRNHKNARFIPSPREEIAVRAVCRIQQKNGECQGWDYRSIILGAHLHQLEPQHYLKLNFVFSWLPPVPKRPFISRAKSDSCSAPASCWIEPTPARTQQTAATAALKPAHGSFPTAFTCCSADMTKTFPPLWFYEF